MAYFTFMILFLWRALINAEDFENSLKDEYLLIGEKELWGALWEGWSVVVKGRDGEDRALMA